MTNTINKIMHNGDEFKFDTSSVSGITTTQPSKPTEGAVYYDTTNDVVKVYDGTNWQSIASGGHDYSWETKTITSGAVELGLRTIVEPTSNFTINAPSNIEDGMEYILRVKNGSTAYTMILGNNIDNVHYVDLTLTANGIDTFSFICVDGILEVQPGIVSRDLTSAENGTDLSVVTTGEKYIWDNKQDALIAGDNIQINGNTIKAKDYIQGEGIIINTAQKGPSPDGFHIPLLTEWQGLKTIMDGLSLTTGDLWRINLHMPFAGNRRLDDVSLYSQGTLGIYWSSYSSSINGYYLSLTSSNVFIGGNRCALGYSLRCFKDSYVTPDSSWTVVQGTLGSAGIFWDQSEGLISITDGTTGYTIMDKNLGATTVYNDGDTLTQDNMGNMYQWGNNYGFPSTGTISNTSSTQVDASGYGPGNYYSSDTFIIGNDNWSSVVNENLWGGKMFADIINTEYIINVSSTAPAVGTANNVITFVIE